ACCAECNTDDQDDEGQACSGGFDPNYRAYSKTRDEAQNKPIEGRWRGLSRNSLPCSRHSKCAPQSLLIYGLFQSSGSFAIFIAIRRASSCVAVDSRPGSTSK